MCEITAERVTAFSAFVGVGVAWWAAVQARKAVRAQNETLQEQIRQSRVTLWREMSDKFDIHLKGDRFKAANKWTLNDYRFKSIHECQGVLDFFDDLALLVKGGLIDTALSKRTFEPYFVGYYLAAEALIEQEISDVGESYRGVKWLKKTWAPNLKLGEFDQEGNPQNRFNAKRFFAEEYEMCAPA
jgi:hypothetical protein